MQVKKKAYSPLCREGVGIDFNIKHTAKTVCRFG